MKLTCLALLVTLVGCGRALVGGGGEEGSLLKLDLPALDELGEDAKKVTGYRLVVKPSDSSCDGTKIDEVKPWGGAINKSVLRRCALDLAMEAGTLAADGTSLGEVLLRGATTVTKDELATGSVSASIKLRRVSDPTPGDDTASLDINVELEDAPKPDLGAGLPAAVTTALAEAEARIATAEERWDGDGDLAFRRAGACVNLASARVRLSAALTAAVGARVQETEAYKTKSAAISEAIETKRAAYGCP